ncbi:3-oxoacyl-ACP synthase [Allokutzneria sp. A3M-2-11 16]|uniref:3-oxoacyl-ACP synthase n=1 Tax=Allokutzneria sp. A3M-2-11 16 TaxID=2962043 RepID=UPI0020B76A1D|nr:3-oxoacyl-ACP synthase [Allokutzneria sp. A3M-2-11 16]MCP3802398.1 3-oxoacyl-ACP synthase [Allokutzneria sp. A3M-2-11 16]
MELGIRAAAWHFPDQVLPVARSDLGIEEVRAGTSDAVELGFRAAASALSEAGLTGHDVSALIVVESRAPERLMTSEVMRLQHLLGADRALTFGVGGLGCASISPALLTARGLLAADPSLANVLVVHGSVPATPERYRDPVTVSGDGGQALLLGRQGPVRVLDIVQETNGEYWDLFGVSYRDVPSAEWRETCSNPAKYSFQLAVETRNRLQALRSILTERHGDTVDCYLAQNLSAAGHRVLGEALGVEIGKACSENLRRYGHLGPNDMFLNLYTAMERGEVGEGQRAMLFNVSPVAAWSAALVEVGASADTFL